ncbi:MAG: DUF4232 domain-containing protein [Actinomycetota bacterium]|nr:DUF4232 domain-containing protein [Actinomycetota bacterium]
MGRMGQRARWAGAAAIVVAALGACGGPTAPAPQSGSQPNRAAPDTAAPASSADCQGTSLVVSAGPGTAGLGHVGVPLLFRNSGTTPCRLAGYPGVAGLTSGGGQTQAARTLGGYLGGLRSGMSSLPVIELAPGEVASALVEGTDAPAGTATSCPSFTALLVTPPNTRQASRLTAGLPGCSGLAVHPVVPGTTGSLS